MHFALFALSLVFQSEWDIAVFFLGAYRTVLHVCVPGMSPIHASIFLDASCTHGNSNTIWGRPRKQYKSDIKRLLSIDAESWNWSTREIVNTHIGTIILWMNDMKHEDYETKQIKVKEQRYATSVVINKAKQYTKVEDATYFAQHSTVLKIDHMYYLKLMAIPFDDIFNILYKIEEYW